MPIDTSHARLSRRRTRIVATVGPASSSSEVLAQLVSAGVDVFRMNMSHGTHGGHRLAYARIREAIAQSGRVAAIMADLCGPKIRTRRFELGGIDLEEGSQLVITTRDVVGGPGLVPTGYQGLPGDVRDGSRILLDDGKLELRVESVGETDVTCRVVAGGRLTDRKGINLPDAAVSAPALTDKDRVDAAFALELGVDALALSFVQRAQDVLDLRALAVEQGQPDVPIVAKIEKPQALEAIDGILDVADAIMVARGDLGVELAFEKVPGAQEQLVRRARRQAKPVIIATQMLESMIGASRPTRAEVSDVHTAVSSSADAMMLSGETAVGEHPIDAVEMMDNIARHAEARQFWTVGFATGDDHPCEPSERGIDSAVAAATAALSRDLQVRSIVVLSRTGATARVMSAARPAAPLLVVTADERVARRMKLLWGVEPIVADFDRDEKRVFASRLVRDLGLAEEGHHILLVRGLHPDPALQKVSISIVTI